MNAPAKNVLLQQMKAIVLWCFPRELHELVEPRPRTALNSTADGQVKAVTPVLTYLNGDSRRESPLTFEVGGAFSRPRCSFGTWQRLSLRKH